MKIELEKGQIIDIVEAIHDMIESEYLSGDADEWVKHYSEICHYHELMDNLIGQMADEYYAKKRRANEK